jgi:hypothetical protein
MHAPSFQTSSLGPLGSCQRRLLEVARSIEGMCHEDRSRSPWGSNTHESWVPPRISGLVAMTGSGGHSHSSLRRTKSP